MIIVQIFQLSVHTQQAVLLNSHMGHSRYTQIISFNTYVIQNTSYYAAHRYHQWIYLQMQMTRVRLKVSKFTKN